MIHRNVAARYLQGHIQKQCVRPAAHPIYYLRLLAATSGDFPVPTGPDVYSYSYEFTLRFAVSFSLVTALAFGLEYWRVSLGLHSLGLQKETMDKKLSEARSVTAGLTRVRSWCNRIRTWNDKWISLATYGSSKEATDVSHAIYPDCARQETFQLKPQ